jgi:cysteinyl-tRNA synthetase
MPKPTFKLYDTMSRQVKPLETTEPGHLRFYSCGPTVYSYAHIGNFRTFLTADLIVRTAMALGWRVTYVSNITDVGHLTEDDMADAGGEDKMARALKSKEGEQFPNIWDLADHYARAFIDDWRKLNLVEPFVRPRATEHMREQIVAVEQLVKDGHAYETDNGVYFSVQSFAEYGKLSGNRDQESLQRGVRDVVQDDNKRHPADFALWKKDDKHLMQWYSPWGWGFPGWHIECSVMAQAYLGDTIDLHAGGEDLVFPHHECEIAQSECLNHKPFSNHWVHTKFLRVDGEKMSKSKGNWYTSRDIVEGKGVDPLALRYALISVPYSKDANFTMQTLEDAIRAVERYKECDRLVDSALHTGNEGEDVMGARLDDLYRDALEAMCNDLNTSVALAKGYESTKIILSEGADMSKASAQAARQFLDRFNALMGIVKSDYGLTQTAQQLSGPTVDEAWIQQKIAERQAAKQAKDFARADAIRNEVDQAGIELRDTPEGTVWKLKTPSL